MARSNNIFKDGPLDTLLGSMVYYFGWTSGGDVKVLCAIDNLASGGAQRQLVTLARLLKNEGDDVQFVTYFPQDFFASQLEEAGIPHHCLDEPGKLRRVLRFYRLVRSIGPDVVLAFLSTPSLLAELSGLPLRRFGLVVSERNTQLTRSPASLLPNLLFHGLADCVVANSHTNRLFVERIAPWLHNRIVTIYNTVDLDRFQPTPVPKTRVIRLLGVGRFAPQKNIPALLVALHHVRTRHPEWQIELDWYGDDFRDRSGALTTASSEYIAVRGLVEQFQLQEVVRLHAPTSDIQSAYQAATALVLPSLFEGLPNVVCEAMACGRPILATDVCDNSSLVHPGRNGVLFSNPEAEAIAQGLEDFAALSQQQHQKMGLESRTLAEELLGQQSFLEHYQTVLNTAVKRKRPGQKHWPQHVPPSAHRTVREYCKRSLTFRD